MADSILYERHNFDNIFNRNVIAGLLYLLNHGISYDQIWQNNIVEDVHVPFVYTFPSDWNERFAQDFYTFFGRECFSDKLIDGKFDMLPRGAVKYTGSSIDAGNITNRFVRGTYLKDENGTLTSYSAYFYSIPLTFNFECEIWVDNIDTAFKIEQAIREAFYKNKSYNVLYKGMKIACCAGFPESVTGDKTVSYAFDSERQMKLNFNLAVETYQPCFDESVAIESSKKIEHFAMDVNHYTPSVTPKDKYVEGKFKDMEGEHVWPSGSCIHLSWTTESNVSDVCTVSLYYTDEEGKHLIAAPLFNNGEYMWSIPENMTGYVQPTISYIETSECSVVEEPKLRIIAENGYLTENSFTIINPGKFETAGDGIMDISVDYIDEQGDTISSDAYGAAIVGGELVKIVLEGGAMKYKRKHQNRKISLTLEYPIDGTVLDKIDNILII